MSIKVVCSSCGNTLVLNDQMAGRTGKCPACHHTITVPLKNDPQLDFIEEEIPVTLPVRPPTGGQKQCPGCQQFFPPDIRVCVQCGLDLDTGEQIARISDTPLYTRKRQTDERKPFYRLVLGMINKPRETLEILPYYLGFPDILINTILFFIVSLLITGVARERYGLDLGREDTKATYQRSYQENSPAGITFFIDLRNKPIPGRQVDVHLSFWRGGPISPPEAYVRISSVAQVPATFDQSQWVRVGGGKWTNTYIARNVPVPDVQGTLYLQARVGHKKPSACISTPISIQLPQTSLVNFWQSFIISVLLNLISVLMLVLLFNLVSIFLKFGTSFIAMTLLLLFVTAYVNLLKLSFPILAMVIDQSCLYLLSWIFMFYQLILVILAMQFSLGVDFGMAVNIALLAYVASQWISVCLATALLSYIL